MRKVGMGTIHSKPTYPINPILLDFMDDWIGLNQIQFLKIEKKGLIFGFDCPRNQSNIFFIFYVTCLQYIGVHNIRRKWCYFNH